MKKFLLIALTFIGTNSFAQCIKTFPYKENFEKFRKTQTSASCDNTIIGDTANGWVQDPSDNGDWRADTSGTTSIGTGPGATDTTSGNGTGTDYNPGTINGVYMYTEASNTTSCSNAVISLISPCLDFSATGKYYKLTFAYHMFGSGMGTLYVDVNDNGVWTNNVWSIGGNQGENWNIAEVPLGKFHSSNVQIRLRSVMGANFQSDMAIDDIVVDTYNPPMYDAELLAGQRYVNEYVFFTPRQGKPFRLAAIVKNNGAKDITGVKVIANCGSYNDTLLLDTIQAFTTKNGIFGKQLSATDTATQERIYFKAILNETDTIKNNERDIFSGLNDTIITRDNGFNTGGLGFNGGTGEIGQAFHFQNKDTLTTVTFFHANPVAGDSVKVKLYTFGTAPGTLLASTPSTPLAAGANWYTLRFPCEQLLDTGNYFIAIEQLNTNNMSLGYTSNFYTPQTVFFNGGAGWTDAATSNFFIALLVRANTGKIYFPNVKLTAAKDTICEKETLLVRASGASSYEWIPASSVTNPTSIQNNVSPAATFQYKVKGTNACKLSNEATFNLNVKKSPVGKITPDTTICYGKSINLTVQSANSYSWIGGPSNAAFNVAPPFGTTFIAKIDSANGCSTSLSVNVSVDHPMITKSNDTTLCEGQSANLTASGLISYKWLSGPSTPDFTVTPTKSRAYIITGKNQRGCDAMDSVRIQVIPGPTIMKSADTSVCFGNRVNLQVSGGVSYQWTGGPSTPQWNFLPFNSEYKYVTVTGSNGCYKTDSIHVNIAAFPVITLGNDTTICEGQGLTLTTNTSEPVAYKWQHGPTTQSINVSPTAKTTYKVTGTNTTGCFGEDSLTVDVLPKAKAGFTFSQNGKNINLTNTSVNQKTLVWYLGDGNSATTPSFLHVYSQDGTYKVQLIVGNECGFDTMEHTFIVNTASLNDAQTRGFKIYPQPAEDLLYVELPANINLPVSMQIIDANGRVVLTENNANENSVHALHMKDLAAGIYQLKISTGGEIYYYKMIRR